jgi:hypothetical protein
MSTSQPAQPKDADIVPLLDPKHDPGNTPDTGNGGATGDKMKAVHYEGPFKVSVKEVRMPTIEHPDDAIIKVTTAGKFYSSRWR